MPQLHRALQNADWMAQGQVFELEVDSGTPLRQAELQLVFSPGQ